MKGIVMIEGSDGIILFEGIRIYGRAVSINAILFLRNMIRAFTYLLHPSSHPS